MNRPFKPLKVGNPRLEKKQSDIASFFGGGRSASSTKSTDERLLKTPQKVQLCRNDSLISRSSSTGAFEDLGSSDTSFGSPEIKNFQNPHLKNTFRETSSKSFIDLTQDASEVNIEVAHDGLASEPTGGESRKRGHLELLNNFNSQKKLKPNVKTKINIPIDEGFDTTELSSEQAEVVKAVVQEGLSVFYTGSAGTGKSVVLKHLIKNLYRVHGNSRVGITASTGLAACNIGGQTIHRFLSIGLGTGSAFELAKRIKKNPTSLKRWKLLRVLIIDEISMVSGDLFGKLDELAKLIRGNQFPFGGIQVVCTGDFFQLPPVKRDGPAQFCFQSPSWSKVMKKTILLTQVFRQKGDTELIDMLNALRRGEITPKMAHKFYQLNREVKYEDGLEPTELFPTREEVKRANQSRLDQIPARPMRYKASDNISDPIISKSLDNLMCEKELELKEGAQVMYLKNLDDKIVNGSIGTILYFMSTKLWDKVNEIYWDKIYDNDLRILDELRLLSSRIGSSQPWNDSERKRYESIPMDRKGAFDRLLTIAHNEAKSDMYPVVLFKTSTNNTLIRVTREDFHLESNKYSGATINDSNQVTRSQLPLLLSWALSIHKAQGQTIDRLKIDLRRIFEKGQVYVALSRATNKDRLQILNFNPQRITTSKEVKEFYDKIEQNNLNR